MPLSHFIPAACIPIFRILPLLLLAPFLRSQDLGAVLPPAPASGPALCPAQFLSPEQGKQVLDLTRQAYTSGEVWSQHAAELRQHIREGLGMAALPRRTPLNAVIRDRREHDGYSVENVCFESIPGYFVTGNLYRPLRASGLSPVVLTPHGHGKVPKTAADFEESCRFGSYVQVRCAMLARMGAIVLSLDGYGYGESIYHGIETHRVPMAMAMQFWNNSRALDFLLSLEGADPKRVAVTGESGGGTQTFLLTALDQRVTVCVPVVMVSSFFFGGCPCESFLPIHRSGAHFASNAIIAALAAPRPMLLVSDGKDWTRMTPEVEHPFIRYIYGLLGAEDHVQNVHLAQEGHDYGPSKRAAMYAFLARELNLDESRIHGAEGRIDESVVAVEHAPSLQVFSSAHPFPAAALKGTAAIEAALRALQKPVAMAAREEIESLLGYLSELPSAVFIRNGSEYGSTQAIEHLRMKWKNQEAEVHSAEDFISRCAEKSYLSGEPYKLRLADGKSVLVGALLRERLAALRAGEAR